MAVNFFWRLFSIYGTCIEILVYLNSKSRASYAEIFNVLQFSTELISMDIFLVRIRNIGTCSARVDISLADWRTDGHLQLIQLNNVHFFDGVVLFYAADWRHSSSYVFSSSLFIHTSSRLSVDPSIYILVYLSSLYLIEPKKVKGSSLNTITKSQPLHFTLSQIKQFTFIEHLSLTSIVS
jgi:hypothetical protein